MEEEIWNNKTHTANTKGEKILKQKLNYNTGIITREELDEILKKFKRRRSAGPDEVPMEVYKEMDDDSLEVLREELNQWWRNAFIPTEYLRSRVVLILKKRGHQQPRQLQTNLASQLHVQNLCSNHPKTIGRNHRSILTKKRNTDSEKKKAQHKQFT